MIKIKKYLLSIFLIIAYCFNIFPGFLNLASKNVGFIVEPGAILNISHLDSNLYAD